MRTVPKNPASMQVALSSIVPLIVGGAATLGAKVIGERFAVDLVPFALVGWCAVLFVSAAWLNQVVFGGAKTLLPFAAAVGVILATWLWQRKAFISLVPGAELTYAYFLKPGGAEARFWVLSCPFWVGLTCLSVCCMLSLILAGRAGARSLLACTVPWWLMAFLALTGPSAILAAQGNAAVLI